MGFRAGNYCTVWEIAPGKGNYMDVRISTSRKNKQTDEYEQDFSGFCRFCGTARAKAEKLKPKDRIKLDDVDVTTRYDKEKRTTYTNYAVFDFSPVDMNPQQAESGFDSNPTDGDVDDNDLPF